MRLAGILVLAAFLTSCGSPDSWHHGSVRFVNQTKMSEAEFQQIAESTWHAAQENVATKTSYDLNGNVVSQPDPAARQVEPSNVVVRGIEEVPAHELNTLPNCKHCPYPDPSGMIYCPAGSGKYCYAYMDNLCTIVVPASKPEYMGPYEMENCILVAMHKPNARNR